MNSMVLAQLDNIYGSEETFGGFLFYLYQALGRETRVLISVAYPSAPKFPTQNLDLGYGGAWKAGYAPLIPTTS